VHGAMDPVIPVEALALAKAALRRGAIDPEWHIVEGLGHGIDPLGFQLGHNFLHQVLD